MFSLYRISMPKSRFLICTRHVVSGMFAFLASTSCRSATLKQIHAQWLSQFTFGGEVGGSKPSPTLFIPHDCGVHARDDLWWRSCGFLLVATCDLFALEGNRCSTFLQKLLYSVCLTPRKPKLSSGFEFELLHFQRATFDGYLNYVNSVLSIFFTHCTAGSLKFLSCRSVWQQIDFFAFLFSRCRFDHWFWKEHLRYLWG